MSFAIALITLAFIFTIWIVGITIASAIMGNKAIRVQPFSLFLFWGSVIGSLICTYKGW